MANEKRRLIDANALIASLRESLDELRRIGDGLVHHDDKQICNGQICTFLEAIMRVREQQPCVDAVEVVRCKDCKHWHEETGWCTEHSHFIGADGEACHPWESNDWKMLNADDFCSYGERKNGK